MQALMDESGCYVSLTHEVVGAIHNKVLNWAEAQRGSLPEFNCLKIKGRSFGPP